VIRLVAIVWVEASVFNACIMPIPGNLYVVQAKPPFKSFALHSEVGRGGGARAKGSDVGWGISSHISWSFWFGG
jgi:hypothetical protein